MLVGSFETFFQSQITYTVLVETLNPAHFLTYKRLKWLAVKGVERRGQRGRSPRNTETAPGRKYRPPRNNMSSISAG